MKKRLLAMLVCICMVVTMLPTMAFADDTAAGEIQLGTSDISDPAETTDTTTPTLTDGADAPELDTTAPALTDGADTPELDTIAPTLIAGEVSRTSDTSAAVSFISNEAGSYYYAVADSGADAPELDTAGNGTDCDTAQQTIAIYTLTAGDKDIYIVVKDAAGNVSDSSFKITIPAYAAPEVVTMMPTAAQASVYTGLAGWENIVFSKKIDVGSGVAPFTISSNDNVYFYGSRTATTIPSVLGVGVRVKGEDTVANLFFYNCYLDFSADHDVDIKFDSPIEILDGASVNIYIAGNCTFIGDYYGTAAIHKQEQAGQLNIYVAQGATLNLNGGFHAAAIGGNRLMGGGMSVPEYPGPDGYNIAIGGPGTFNITGGSGAPAIGSGNAGSADNICIGMVDVPEFPSNGVTSGNYHFYAVLNNNNPTSMLAQATPHSAPTTPPPAQW